MAGTPHFRVMIGLEKTMERFENPFHDLWVTEDHAPEKFVKLFSHVVVQKAEQIFKTGNIVVRGRQGSGKSMLLNLLGTSTRLEYHRAQENYPVPSKLRCFISASINLTRDNASIVASRLRDIPEDRRKEWAALTFGDYLNYFLCIDLLRNVQLLSEAQGTSSSLRKEIPIEWAPDVRKRFVGLISNSPVWGGYLAGCTDIDDLVERLSQRIRSYLRYFNYHDDSLPDSVEKSKTVIGEPIAQLSDALKTSGVLPKDANVFVRIDQHEELYELEKSSGYGALFRQVINRALAARDNRIFYRIGTRHYAWETEVTTWGSGAKLEHLRNFDFVDLDLIFKRHENSSTRRAFDEFANDVFERRLRSVGIDLSSQPQDWLTSVLGASIPPKDRAKRYASATEFEKVIEVESNWHESWMTLLKQLWQGGDPLGAKLGVAWLKQRQQVKTGVALREAPEGTPEWLTERKQYWRKERNEAALVQIAGDAAQSMIWSGSRHVLDLSGSNILAFTTLCRSIWAAWLRKSSDKELRTLKAPKIEPDEQVIGIYEASRVWFEKIRDGQDGDRRYSFVQSMAAMFIRSLRTDRVLSNPGHNGFSLARQDFETNRLEVVEVIKSCRDHGDLMESNHTTKEKSAELRIKWYLNPILSPFFRIPHIRTKEPIYTTVRALAEKLDEGIAMADKKASQPRTTASDDESGQGSLFE